MLSPRIHRIADAPLGEEPAPRYSVCTLVTDLAQYERLQASFRAGGFDGASTEYLFIDNGQGQEACAYAGGNALLAAARGRYVILCHQDVRLIRAGGQQLLDLINDILDMSIIESGELRLHFEATDVAAMIRDVVQIHKSLVHDKGVVLQTEIGPDVQVLDEQLALRRVRPRLGPQPARVLRLNRPVDLAPVQGAPHAGLVDDEAVVRAAPGMRAGRGAQRAVPDQHAFTTGDGQLRQRGRGQVPADQAVRGEAQIVETVIIDGKIGLLPGEEPPCYLLRTNRLP